MQADEVQNAKEPIAAQIDLSGQTLRGRSSHRVPCQDLDLGAVIAKRPPLSNFALRPPLNFSRRSTRRILDNGPVAASTGGEIGNVITALSTLKKSGKSQYEVHFFLPFFPFVHSVAAC